MTISAPSEASFITLNAASATIKIADLSDKAIRAATYALDLILDDSHDTVTYKMHFVIRELTIMPVVEEQ